MKFDLQCILIFKDNPFIKIMCKNYVVTCFFQILETLAKLPIPNKTMLQDSKVLSVIEKWSTTALTVVDAKDRLVLFNIYIKFLFSLFSWLIDHLLIEAKLGSKWPFLTFNLSSPSNSRHTKTNLLFLKKMWSNVTVENMFRLFDLFQFLQEQQILLNNSK